MGHLEKPFVVLGIVGGVGSGKSSLTKWICERLPLAFIDADRLGHFALTVSEVKEKLIQRFGVRIVDSNGEISRAELGSLVWGESPEATQARKDLEAIVHPVIRASLEEAIDKAYRGEYEGIVVDAAVILEAGWHSVCDKIIFVDTPDSKRLEHVTSSRNWTKEQWQQREQSQLSLEDKKKQSDFIVDNSGSLDQSGQQLLDWLSREYTWNVSTLG